MGNLRVIGRLLSAKCGDFIVLISAAIGIVSIFGVPQKQAHYQLEQIWYRY